MTILNYININNIEKDLNQLKNTYDVSKTLYLTTLNKTSLMEFYTPSLNAKIMIYSFNEEIKNSLIIKSSEYNFGKITEEISFTIELYNNTNTDMTIENINIVNLSNINLSIEDLTVKNQKSNIIIATISQEGDSENSGYIELLINDKLYYITIEYQRESVFSYFADRSDNISVNYSFNTNIKKSLNGKEVREGNIENPRFFVDYIYIEDNNEKRKFENNIISNNYGTLFLPIWTEKFNATKIGTKIYGDYKHTNINVGSRIYIWEVNKNQVATVLSINDDFIEVDKIADSFIKFFVYPLIVSRINPNVSSTKITKNMSKFLISFEAEEDQGYNLLENNYNFNYQELDGVPFYDFLRDNQASTERTFLKSVVRLDNDVSKRSSFVKYSIAETISTFNIVMFNKKEITQIKDIFKRTVGALRSFFTLKDDYDLEILENLQKDSKMITIRDVNSLILFNNNVFQYIYILYNQKEPMILKIEEIRKGTNNKEIIIVDNIPENLNINKIRFVSYISKCRFNTDVLTINYKNDVIADANISIININNKE